MDCFHLTFWRVLSIYGDYSEEESGEEKPCKEKRGSKNDYQDHRDAN